MRFVPDNTVLVNVTILDDHDLLSWFVRSRGTWTLSIARECSRSANTAGLSEMRQWRRVFGTPWSPTPAEVVDAQAIADAIRKPGDASPSAHMGEAEAIAVLVSRGINAVFLTDDYDAARAAARYPLIGVASTTKILALAEAAGRIRHGEARTHLATLLSAGRVLGNPPSIADYDTYVAALKIG